MAEFTYEPPAGMTPAVGRAWREFFRKAASGTAGYTASPEMYLITYKAQLGRCFICQVAKGINPEDPRGRGTQRLGWDHNHATGAVRGLLCTKGQWSCNRIVGRYRDNPQAFRRAARYLEQPPALILARVQELAGDLSVDERVALAVQLLGVEREALESKVNRARLLEGTPAQGTAVIMGHSPSFVTMDEVSSIGRQHGQWERENRHHG
jgi:recombination endonuclease VII